jgi:hypothetical protein
METSIGVNKDTRPAPLGSVADLKQSGSPRSVTSTAWVNDGTPEEAEMVMCAVRTVGIAQDASSANIVVRRLIMDGVLLDSGTNSCMTNSERYLVKCRDIAPVSVGLAMKSGEREEPVMYEYTRMGYMPLTS